MAKIIVFDARFTNNLGVGQLVDTDIRVEIFEEGNSVAKEIRVIGADRSSSIISSTDASGVFYTTTVDVGSYVTGDAVAKWFANLAGNPTQPFPFLEAIPTPSESSLTVSEVKDYIRTMLGFPTIAIELLSEHYSVIADKVLATYNQYLPRETFESLDLVVGQSRYPMPQIGGRGVTDVKFIRKEGTPLICFTGDTQVKLLDGRIRTMKQLSEEYGKDEDFWVYSYDIEKKKVVPGKARNPVMTSKREPIVKVTLDDGSSVRCTKTHQWLLSDGTYKEAQHLTENDELMPLHTQESKKDDGKILEGYEMIHQSEKLGWRYTHRMVATEVYGEDFLEAIDAKYKEEGKGSLVIHHAGINEKGVWDKKNNDPRCLEVTSWAEHGKVHAEGQRGVMRARWQDPEFRAKILKSFQSDRKKAAQIKNLSIYNEWIKGLMRDEIECTYECYKNKGKVTDEERAKAKVLKEKHSALMVRANKKANEAWKDPKVHANRVAGINAAWTGDRKKARVAKLNANPRVMAALAVSREARGPNLKPEWKKWVRKTTIPLIYKTWKKIQVGEVTEQDLAKVDYKEGKDYQVKIFRDPHEKRHVNKGKFSEQCKYCMEEVLQ